MVLRQARLTARLLLATIFALALWSLFHFGPYHMLPGRIRPGAASDMPVWETALRYPGLALFWSLAYDFSSRSRRWRRNIVRAGNVFATTWISTLTLVLALQILILAEGLGYSIDRRSAFAGLIGILLLFRANVLPKSRPAWFNGIALPIFASRADVWRRVHRASAVRIIMIAVISLFLAIFAPRDFDPILPIAILLLIELVTASAHGLWLGSTPEKDSLRQQI